MIRRIADHMRERILDLARAPGGRVRYRRLAFRARCPCRARRRSRRMRGSFCQALLIGCIRVRITPSCNSAVTLDSRCSGTLNSESSCRRAMSSSWLRVSTSSDTMDIRFSSVSTLTLMDVLASLPSALSSASTGAFSGWGPRRRRRHGPSDIGPGVSWNTRSSLSSETSPGINGRVRVCGADCSDADAAHCCTMTSSE